MVLFLPPEDPSLTELLPSAVRQQYPRPLWAKLSEVVLLRGSYVTAQIPSLLTHLSSLPLTMCVTAENKGFSEAALMARGGSVCSRQRLVLCHSSDKLCLCPGTGRGLALLCVWNSGGICLQRIQCTTLPCMKTPSLPSPLVPSLGRKQRGSHAANVTLQLFLRATLIHRIDFCLVRLILSSPPLLQRGLQTDQRGIHLVWSMFYFHTHICLAELFSSDFFDLINFRAFFVNWK